MYQWKIKFILNILTTFRKQPFHASTRQRKRYLEQHSQEIAAVTNKMKEKREKNTLEANKLRNLWATWLSRHSRLTHWISKLTSRGSRVARRTHGDYTPSKNVFFLSSFFFHLLREPEGKSDAVKSGFVRSSRRERVPSFLKALNEHSMQPQPRQGATRSKISSLHTFYYSFFSFFNVFLWWEIFLGEYDINNIDRTRKIRL